MAEVRVVRLIRKEIGERDREKQDNRESKVSFLATDYFDIMQVDSIDVEKSINSLAAIMGIWPAEKPDEDEIVAHSYSLYFNEEMLQQEKGRMWCGDPFAKTDQEDAMPVLSMIQVYIIPDIMACAIPGASAEVIVNALYRDLHETIEQFREQHPEAVFLLRIFKVLSTGDFAIAVRSTEVETSFQISSAIRQRAMVKEKSDGTLRKLVMYKTYTLLTFSNGTISSQQSEGEDQFVLRGCYSNLYWSRKKEIEQSLEGKNLWPGTKIFGLNGRYDFSVRIKEKEFNSLYPEIQRYKAGEKVTAASLDEKKDISIVDYIMYLMDKRYLSYINERCLISQKEWMVQLSKEDGCCKMDFSPDFAEEGFLESKINAFYTAVRKKYLNVKGELAKIPARRKNLMQYTELLGKLVQLCYSISISADARVYAAALLKQLDVVIDSIIVYVKMYHKEEQDENEQVNILNLLEVYIRESVQALDSYAKYIRNRNLQSIQTPNYNLESNMGMEKFLIGYGEMLDIFAKFYQKKYPLTNSGDKARELLPIVVPALHQGDMSVEVLFMEGVTKDWAAEKSLWEETDRNEIRHCMVVSVPTLMELGDVRTMVVTLFHENAHQYHDYEPVSQRNDALLRYAVHTVMGEAAEKLVTKMQQELGVHERELWFVQFLQANLTNAYLHYYYKENGEKSLEYSFQDAPLNNFQERLICDFKNCLEKKIQVADLKEHFGDFLRELRCHMVREVERYSDAIILMGEIIQGGTDKISEENAPLVMVERIMKCAYVLALGCACQHRANVGIQSWEKKNWKEWVMATTAPDFDFQQDWIKHFGTDAYCDNEEEPCCMIWKIFNDFANWVDKDYEESLRAEDSRKDAGGSSGKSFYEEAYECLCEAWEKQEDRRKTARNSARVQEAMGRMLGIDYNSTDNRKIFEKELSSVFQQELSGLVAGVKWRIGKYREETADMMMCNVLKLSSFGYLSLLAANWPIDKNLPDAFVARLVNVFLFQWCLDKKDICPKKVLANCIDLVSHLEKAVVALEKNFGEDKCGVENQYVKEMPYDGLIEILADLERRCEELCGHDPGRYSLERPKVYRNMARLAKTVIDYSPGMIDYMDIHRELKEDYIRAVTHYNGLNDEMCGDADPQVQKVGKFCIMIGSWQNDPSGFLADAKKRGEMNSQSIEFLLDMYYINKRRIAQEVQQKNVI